MENQGMSFPYRHCWEWWHQCSNWRNGESYSLLAKGETSLYLHQAYCTVLYCTVPSRNDPHFLWQSKWFIVAFLLFELTHLFPTEIAKAFTLILNDWINIQMVKQIKFVITLKHRQEGQFDSYVVSWPIPLLHPLPLCLQCNDLVESLTQKASIRAPVTRQALAGSAPVRTAPTGGQQEKLPPPRPTILTLTRLVRDTSPPARASFALVSEALGIVHLIFTLTAHHMVELFLHFLNILCKAVNLKTGQHLCLRWLNKKWSLYVWKHRKISWGAAIYVWMETAFILFFFMQSNRENRPNKDSTQRTITWRPNSAKAVIPPGETVALHFNRIYDGSFFSSDVFTMAIHQTISCMTIKNISMSQMAFVEAWKGLLFHGIYCVLVL